MLKLTAKQLANMSRLFESSTDEELAATERHFTVKALQAGVDHLAAEGFTMEEWEMILDPRKVVKDRILADREEAARRERNTETVYMTKEAADAARAGLAQVQQEGH